MRIVLLILALSCTAWFCVKSGYGAWNYVRLNRSTEAKIQEWGIEDRGSSAHIAAAYVYEVKGCHYEGKTIFKEPEFLNRFAAEEQMKVWQQHQYQVWYASSNPSMSSLQKLFPYKSTLYAFVTIGLCLYFFFFLKKFKDC